MDSKRCFARGRGGGSAKREGENVDVGFDGDDLVVDAKRWGVEGFVGWILERVMRRREVRVGVLVRNDMVADGSCDFR